MPTDRELLQAYANGSQDAFGELVARHAGWVYGVAARAVGDRQLAEDVTQSAFLVLARKGPSLKEGTVVTAWLFRTVRNTALEAVRRETRRRRREAAAAVRDAGTSEATWDDVAPLLDGFVERLPARDRRAVTLRFFGGRAYADIAGELGTTEHAARKVVARAVERLRGMYTRTGVVTNVAAIESLAVAHAADAHGTALTHKLVAAAGAAGAAGKGASYAGALAATGVGVAVTLGVVVCAVHMRAGATPPAAGPSARVVEPLRPSARPVGLSLEEIRRGVVAAEGAIRNVHVRHFSTTHEKLVGGKTWTVTPVAYSGSAWYERPGRRMRVYFRRNVLPWIGGNAPYAEQEIDDGFDGREGREARVSSTTAQGTRLASNVGQFNPGQPPAMISDETSQYATGRNFALPFIWADGGHVSDWIAGATPDVARETVNGFDAVRLSWGTQSRGGWVAVWLVPDKGYAAVRYERIVAVPGRAQEGDTDEVFTLKQAAPGVWFPVAARRTQRDLSNPGRIIRYTYKCQDVVVNDPAFDPAIFSVKFAPGYLVNNMSAAGPNYVAERDGTLRRLADGEGVGNAEPHQIPEP